MTAREGNSTEIKFLTKKRRDTGEVYTRRPDAQLQIEKVLSLEKAQIVSMLDNHRRDAGTDYLLDETITYLLREAHAEAENEYVEALYLEINRRIWKLIGKFRKNFKDASDFEDFGQKTGLTIIKKIFDLQGDSSDYAQVNFGDFVVTQAKVVWRQELVRINRDKEVLYSEREDGDENSPDKLETTIASKEAPADYNLVLRDGFGKLPPHIMTVAELLLDGWQIESKLETEPTISKKLGVSSRTIRNWLAEARTILAGYRGEVRR